jgi:aspartyl-tRNA(Asn)/glutamyl-tRNA(Gln) amidotransferase subunit C
MKLDDVQRIAHLSSLELSQAEAEAVLPQFLRDLAQPLRKDGVTETDHRAENMQFAPAVQDGYFLVPRVIE